MNAVKIRVRISAKLKRTMIRLLIVFVSIPINAFPILLKRIISPGDFGGVKGILEYGISDLDFTYLLVAATIIMIIELCAFDFSLYNEGRKYSIFLCRLFAGWIFSLIVFYIINISNSVAFSHFKDSMLRINIVVLSVTMLFAICSHVIQYLCDRKA